MAETSNSPAPASPAPGADAVPSSQEADSQPEATPIANPLLAAVVAWVVPGLGHVFLKRQLRGIAFFVLIMVSLLIGWHLEGNLYRPLSGQPLTYLGTLGAMGLGIPYFILRYGYNYQGNLVAVGYEYGTAFILTAGLMNLLLVLDAWDIASGKKE